MHLFYKYIRIKLVYYCDFMSKYITILKDRMFCVSLHTAHFLQIRTQEDYFIADKNNYIQYEFRNYEFIGFKLHLNRTRNFIS